MSEDLSQQLEEAEKQLDVYQEALIKAEGALATWVNLDLHRQDGSQRQDRLHDEWGEECKDDVCKARHEVKRQQALIDELRQRLSR